MTQLTDTPKRSDEPIWWALFSAGGVCFAVVIPGAILALALLPAAWGVITAESLSYARISAFMYQALWGLAGLAFVAAAICLPLFHAAHRLHHGLHDLQLGGGLLSKLLCYGLAALGGAAGFTLIL